MTYRTKYRTALIIAIIGGFVVTAGSFEIQGSFGVRDIIESGVIKLAIGLILFIVAVPAFYYIRAQGDPRSRKTALEIEAIKRKANLRQ